MSEWMNKYINEWIDRLWEWILSRWVGDIDRTHWYWQNTYALALIAQAQGTCLGNILPSANLVTYISIVRRARKIVAILTWYAHSPIAWYNFPKHRCVSLFLWRASLLYCSSPAKTRCTPNFQSSLRFWERFYFRSSCLIRYFSLFVIHAFTFDQLYSYRPEA